jgi:hypothetical protein
MTDAVTPNQPDSAPPPVAHLMRASEVQYARVSRGYGIAAATAELVASRAASGRFDADTLRELMQLQMALCRRTASMADSWIKEWSAWWDYAGQTKGINTASKLAERQTNIIAQMMLLMGSQVTDLVGLQENTEVNFAYWISQKR